MQKGSLRLFDLSLCLLSALKDRYETDVHVDSLTGEVNNDAAFSLSPVSLPSSSVARPIWKVAPVRLNKDLGISLIYSHQAAHVSGIRNPDLISVTVGVEIDTITGNLVTHTLKAEMTAFGVTSETICSAAIPFHRSFYCVTPMTLRKRGVSGMTRGRWRIWTSRPGFCLLGCGSICIGRYKDSVVSPQLVIRILHCHIHQQMETKPAEQPRGHVSHGVRYHRHAWDADGTASGWRSDDCRFMPTWKSRNYATGNMKGCWPVANGSSSHSSLAASLSQATKEDLS